MDSETPSWKDRLRQERIRHDWRQRDLAERLGTATVTVTRWEQGSHEPSAYFRVKLCALFGKSPQELGFVPDATPSEERQPVSQETARAAATPHPTEPDLWSVPYARNPFFTGRKEILSQLHAHLHQVHATALTQAWAVSGLGGIGKTQVALEYVYQYRQEYRSIFWTNAASQENLMADLVNIADTLQLPERFGQDQMKKIAAVKRWFATHEGWLWILDNADDLELVQDFVPTERPGYLLLTTRAQALGSLAQRIEIETMGMVEGTLFLLRRARILAPEDLLENATEEQLATAEAIAIAVDFLPLALDQAGAYIEEVGCSLADYLELYQTHCKELLQRRGHMSADHPESVATTWSLSFQKIEQASPAAADMLRFCTFLEPDTIPEELIYEGVTRLGLLPGSTGVDTLQLHQAIEELRRFSLIQRNPETRILRVHRLVQAVLKDAMDTSSRRQWMERAVQATGLVFPAKIEMANWPRCQRMLSQAQACSSLIQEQKLLSEQAASLLFRCATYLQEQALYEQAEVLYQQALAIRKQALEAECLEVTRSMNGLANLYLKQGKYEQAKALHQQALQMQEETLGSEHLEIARSLTGLANLSFEQGTYEETEALHLRALHILELASDSTATDIATSLNGLGLLYWRQGKYELAETFFLRVLHTWEQALGTEHLSVAYVLNNLANLYREQSKYELAEALYQRALAIQEQVLGPDHPEMATQLNNMAILYKDLGKYELAKSLYQRALAIQEQVRGPDHPHTALVLNNLAVLYRELGDYTQAETTCQRSLDILEKVLGFENTLTAHPLHGLATIYFKQGRYAEAEARYQQTLQMRERLLEAGHPDIAETLHELGVLREAQGRHLESIAFYKRALGLRDQTLGVEHPDALATRQRLVALLRSLERRDEAAVFAETRAEQETGQELSQEV